MQTQLQMEMEMNQATIITLNIKKITKNRCFKIFHQVQKFSIYAYC